MQITFFGLCAIALARKMSLRMANGFPEKLLSFASLERAITLGIFLIAAGVFGALTAIFQWGHSSFGQLVPDNILRITIPSVTMLALGTQLLFGAFLLSFIEIE
jgi:hypothetical protein